MIDEVAGKRRNVEDDLENEPLKYGGLGAKRDVEDSQQGMETRRVAGGMEDRASNTDD